MTYREFPNRECAAFAGFICRSIDRIVACLTGLDEEQLSWRPPAPQTNSLYTLAIHTMANAEENILSTLCKQPTTRERYGEFNARSVSATEAEVRWRELRGRLTAALRQLDPTALDREIHHPRRGPLTGREILIVVARHAAEHQGQAELTRDLLRASGEIVKSFRNEKVD